MSKPAVLFGGAVATTAFSALLSEPTAVRKKISKADRLRHSLQAMKQAAREEGYESGRLEGLASGRAEGRTLGISEGKNEADQEYRAKLTARFEQLETELAEMAGGVQGALDEFSARVEHKLHELALEIAVKVIGQELASNPLATLSIVRSTLSEVKLSANARIRIAPFQAETLREHREALLTACRSLREIEIVEDDSITGGCVIETDGGTIDGTVSGQLLQLAQQLEAA